MPRGIREEKEGDLMARIPSRTLPSLPGRIQEHPPQLEGSVPISERPLQERRGPHKMLSTSTEARPGPCILKASLVWGE